MTHKSYVINLDAIASSATNILPPFRLGTLAARMCRDARVLLVSTLQLARRSFEERTADDAPVRYTGSLYDAYEDALIELAHRCHAEHQLGYMVAMLVDDWKQSHFLVTQLGGFVPTSSLRLWTTLDDLWGRPFSTTTTTTVPSQQHDQTGDGSVAMLEVDSCSPDSSISSSSNSGDKMIRERRRDTLIRCILSDEPEPKATSPLPINTPTPSVTLTNNARAHFCVNCGAHTEGWPREWKRYDPLLQVVWCRSCYMPNVITRHALLRHYNVDAQLLDSLPSVYTHSRASKGMLCYLFEQVFDNVPIKRRLRVQRRLVRDNTLTTATAVSARRMIGMPPSSSSSSTGSVKRAHASHGQGQALSDNDREEEGGGGEATHSGAFPNAKRRNTTHSISNVDDDDDATAIITTI